MMRETAEDAVAIAAELLEITGAALHSGDSDAFADCFHLPNTLATMDGLCLLETVEDVRNAFRKARAHYAEIGLARLDRRIVAALFDGADQVRNCFVTRFLDGNGHELRPSVASLGRAARIDGRWLITGTQYAVHKDSDQGRALLEPGPAIQLDAAGNTPAEAVFQNLLDRVTRAYLEDRFDLLEEAVQLPLFVQASESTKVFTTTADLEADFRRYMTRFLVHRVTDVVRRVTHAEQVGDRRIHGAYRTHILSDAQLVIPAYNSATTLEQGDDLAWRMTSIIHPMGHLTLDRESEAEAIARRATGRPE